MRGYSGWGGKCGSDALVPSSKMALSGQAQRRGREAVAAAGWSCGASGRRAGAAAECSSRAPIGDHLEAKCSPSDPQFLPQ